MPKPLLDGLEEKLQQDAAARQALAAAQVSCQPVHTR